MSVFKKVSYITILLVCQSTFLHAAKVYTATVVPMIKSSIQTGTDYGNSGTVEFVASAGDIIYPSIFDKKGNIIKQGTILIQLEKSYWQDQVNSAKEALSAAEADLITDKENYLRMKKLIDVKVLQSTNVESVQTFQSAKKAYFDSLANLNKANKALVEACSVLDACTLYAPFEGVVDKVYYTKGKAIGLPKVMDVSLLNPIGIFVEMPRDDAKKISTETPVKIYPVNSQTPIGALYGNSILKDSGILFMTLNKPMRISNTNTAVSLYPVTKFYIDKYNDETLSVPVKFINKDEQGSYVWKAADQKTMQKNRGIDESFDVQKVYIKTINKVRVSAGYCNVQAIEKNSNLAENDILAMVGSKFDHKKQALRPVKRYTLMPGEKVKVVVGN